MTYGPNQARFLFLYSLEAKKAQKGGQQIAKSEPQLSSHGEG